MSKKWKIYRWLIDQSAMVLGLGWGILAPSLTTSGKIGSGIICMGVLLLDHREGLRRIEDKYDD